MAIVCRTGACCHWSVSGPSQWTIAAQWPSALAGIRKDLIRTILHAQIIIVKSIHLNKKLPKSTCEKVWGYPWYICVDHVECRFVFLALTRVLSWLLLMLESRELHEESRVSVIHSNPIVQTGLIHCWHSSHMSVPVADTGSVTGKNELCTFIPEVLILPTHVLTE